MILKVAKLLGHSDLFHVFDTSDEDDFSSYRCEQILKVYSDLGFRNQLGEATNPIKWKPLVVSGHDSEVVMDLMDAENNDKEACKSLVLIQQQVHMLAGQVLHLRSELMVTLRLNANLLS